MRGGDQVSFPPTWIANGSSTIYWKVYPFCTEVQWHLCCKSNDNMCVRLCLYSILFHFCIFENLSTNTTCHSDLLAIIANWKIFTAFTCRAIFAIWSLHNTIQTSYHGILILVSGNLRPHSLCRGHSGLLSRVALGSHIRDLIHTLPGSPYGSHICHVHSYLLITHQLNATSSVRPSSLN